MRVLIVSVMCLLFSVPAWVIGFALSFIKAGFIKGYEDGETTLDDPYHG